MYLFHFLLMYLQQLRPITCIILLSVFLSLSLLCWRSLGPLFMPFHTAFPQVSTNSNLRGPNAASTPASHLPGRATFSTVHGERVSVVCAAFSISTSAFECQYSSSTPCFLLQDRVHVSGCWHPCLRWLQG